MLTAGQLRAFILETVSALRSGRSTGAQDALNAQLDNLFPDGATDSARQASPFGLISGVPQGTAGFYMGLFGSRFERILLGWLHAGRPQPTGPGETVLYSTTPDGQQIQVKVVLGADGSLTISAPGPVNVQSPQVSLAGSQIQLGTGGEKTINGETFITDFLKHTHTSGGPGSPTTAPINAQGAAAYLSQTVKAQK